MGGDKCNPDCNPEVGCVAIMNLKEELVEHNLDQARSSARMELAATQAEQMVGAFERCLASIEQHTLTLNDGSHVMERLDRDITSVAEASRDHFQLADGTNSTHRSLERRMGSQKKFCLWSIGLLSAAVAVIYGVALSSPLGPKIWETVINLIA